MSIRSHCPPQPCAQIRQLAQITLIPVHRGILYADLDPDMIAIAKATADPVGHYARPDVLRLYINREKRHVIQTNEDHGSLQALQVESSDNE